MYRQTHRVLGTVTFIGISSFFCVVIRFSTIMAPAEVFCEYIGNVFAPHLGKYNVKFPVFLLIDGHCIDLTY
jgi:hypothetical protein